jgi:hypothetical protein
VTVAPLLTLRELAEMAWPVEIRLVAAPSTWMSVSGEAPLALQLVEALSMWVLALAALECP